MKLIVGLGNPGRSYQNTRHNAGFKILEKLVSESNAEWGNEAKANALISRLSIDGKDVILALPQSYMNLSGQVVVDLLRWFKLDKSNLIIVHDELDLQFGTIQIKKNIGDAGHNGVKSIIEKIGEDFVRIRIGIGADTSLPLERFVLDKFSNEELERFSAVEKKVIEKLNLLVKYGYDEFMSKYNS